MTLNITPLNVLNAILAIAGVLAGLSPALLGPYGATIVGASVLALNIGHSILSTKTPAPGTVTVAVTPPSVPKALAGVLMFMAVAALCQPLVACKSTPTANQQAEIAVAIDLAVGVAVQQGSPDAGVWKARATAFEAIAKTIKTANDAGAVSSLATLQADLQPLIAKLGPADTLAANALVAAVTPYLNQYIASHPEVGTTQAALDIILADIISACSAYTGA